MIEKRFLQWDAADAGVDPEVAEGDIPLIP